MRYLLLLVVMLAGCERWPDLARAPEGPREPYPALVPIDGLLAEGEAAREAEADATLAERAADLRSRAAGMQGPAIEPEIRAAMEAAAAREP